MSDKNSQLEEWLAVTYFVTFEGCIAEPVDKNRQLEQRLASDSIAIDGYKARDENRQRALSAAKIEMTIIKEALRMIEERASRNMSFIHAAVEERNWLRRFLATESSKRTTAENSFGSYGGTIWEIY